MNDNYKELAQMASAWCERYAEGAPVAWEWEKKFAELVVRECIIQISSLMDYSGYDTDELNFCELKAQRDACVVIKQHFGLK